MAVMDVFRKRLTEQSREFKAARPADKARQPWKVTNLDRCMERMVLQCIDAAEREFNGK